MSYYLSDIIGTGEADIDEYRPAVADYPVNWSCSMPAHPDTGAPLNDWGLVEVTKGDVSLLELDPRIDTLPKVSLSTLVADIAPGDVAAMRSALDSRGIGSGIVDTAAIYGDIIAGISLRANAGTVTPALGQATL